MERVGEVLIQIVTVKYGLLIQELGQLSFISKLV